MQRDTAEIAPGSRVRLHFSIGTTDGTRLTSTFDEEPAELVLGNGSLIEGLELALYGLKAGDSQTLTLTPDQAFGPRDDAKIHQMPRADFPQDMQLEEGLIIAFQTPNGDELAGIILALDGDQAKVDFNHPLAGHEVLFQVEILQVEPPEDGETPGNRTGMS